MGIGVDLELQRLTRRFGGLVANDDISLSVPANTFLSLIGPNGAGKTTLFNLVTGALTPSEGHILFGGRDVTALSPHRRVMLGMSRVFQISSTFPGLTVLENVRLAAQAGRGTLRLLTSHRSFAAYLDEAMAQLERVDLAERAEDEAGSLSHGEKRRLELAMALAARPRLLLLDEPTAGIGVAEMPALMQLLQGLRAERTCTVLMVEHKIDVVMSLSDRIAVLHQGRLLTVDTPEAVSNNAAVQQAYLGGGT